MITPAKCLGVLGEAKADSRGVYCFATINSALRSVFPESEPREGQSSGAGPDLRGLPPTLRAVLRPSNEPSLTRATVLTGTPPNASVGDVLDRGGLDEAASQALAGRKGIEKTIGRVASLTFTSEPPRAPAWAALTRSRAYAKAAASSLRSAALSCASLISARTVKKYWGMVTPQTPCSHVRLWPLSVRKASEKLGRTVYGN
jgi:hypothetical protein